MTPGMPSITVGSVVRLRSGGPLMTVYEFARNEGTAPYGEWKPRDETLSYQTYCARVVWFDGPTRHTDLLPVAALKLAGE